MDSGERAYKLSLPFAYISYSFSYEKVVVHQTE